MPKCNIDWKDDLAIIPEKQRLALTPEDLKQGNGLSYIAKVTCMFKGSKRSVEILFNEDKDSRFFEVWEDVKFSDQLYSISDAVKVAKKWASGEYD